MKKASEKKMRTGLGAGRLSLIKRGGSLLLVCLYLLILPALCLAEAKWPSAPGTVTETSGKLAVDLSNISEGYFMAAAPGGAAHRLKLRVEKDGMTLTYDLNVEGEYEVFPLQLGSGSYVVSLYENVGGKKYAQQGGTTVNVQLTREDAAFLYPNQYIHYTELSPLVEKAAELCGGLGEKEIYDTVCAFVTSEFVYDYIRALTIPAGELPDADGAYEKRMGICQDLSAVTVGMLRTMGIPGRMIIGYADDQYHAWTSTMVEGVDRFYDPTAAVGGITTVKDYSVERYY